MQKVIGCQMIINHETVQCVFRSTNFMVKYCEINVKMNGEIRYKLYDKS